MDFILDQATFTDDGEYVLRTGKIFQAGSYPDKKFDLSSDEMKTAVSSFKPVEIDIEHAPSVFDGKLGKLEAVQISDNGQDLIGTARIPKWLDKVLGEGAKKVSATWDRATKTLNKLALVRNPRVADAALMAAFSASEVGTEIEPIVFKALEAYFSDSKNLEEFAHSTWEGKSTLQSIHDTAARAGAICTESKADMTADFVSAGEAKSIQQVHDLAVKGGAKCSSSGMCGYSNDKETSTMNLKDIAAYFRGLKDEELEGGAEKVVEKPAEAKAVEAVKLSTEPTAREKELEEELTTLKAREATYKAAEAAYKAKEIVAEAEKFVDGEITKGTAFPAERSGAVALYAQAAKDDAATGTKVSFKKGDVEVEDTRVEAFKSLFSVRKPHGLTVEELTASGAGVLEAEMSDKKDYVAEAAKQAKDYAAKVNTKAVK